MAGDERMDGFVATLLAMTENTVLLPDVATRLFPCNRNDGGNYKSTTT